MIRGRSITLISALLLTCTPAAGAEWDCIPETRQLHYNFLGQPPQPPTALMDPWELPGLNVTPAQEWSKQVRARQVAAMEDRHPYAMKICETSQASRSKPANSSEGPLEPFQGTTNGHLFYFLKGACIDRGGSYEQLALCKDLPICNPKKPVKNCIAGYDPGFSNDGTEVGVEEYHKNRSHLLVPGWQLAMDGIPDEQLNYSYDLVTGENLSPIDKMVQRQLKLGIVKGVKGVRLVDGKLLPMSDEEMAKAAISTIVAIRRYRNVKCINLFLDTEEEMKAAIQAANDDNRPYATGEKTFGYNGVAQNCVRDVRKPASALKLEIRPEETDPSNINGINLAKRMKRSAENGNGISAWIVHKLAPDADKVRANDLSTDIAAPAMDMKHYISVAARPIAGPKQAFQNANDRGAIEQFGRFPPQLGYEQLYRQTLASEFGADDARSKPPDDLSNAVFKDHEKVKVEEIRLTPYEAVEAKLAQYQAALAAIRKNPKDPNSPLKTAEEILASETAGLPRDTLRAQGFNSFYTKYVQALNTGIESLQKDHAAMDAVSPKFDPMHFQPCGSRLTDRNQPKPGLGLFSPPAKPASPFGFSAR